VYFFIPIFTTLAAIMTHTVQELALVIAVKNHDPLMVGEAFLKQTGIIPSEWDLAQKPYLSQQATQLVFTNGLSIIAEPERVIFTQPLVDKALSTIEVGEIASKYAAILKKAEYQGIGINFRSFIPQPTQEAAQAYISQYVLAPASWQQVGSEPVRANVNLNFTLSGRQLALSINPAAIQFPEQEPMPVILFGGNFGYQLDATDKLAQLTQIITNWQTDLIEYHQLITQHFVAKQELTIEHNEPMIVLPVLAGVGSN
jgi:hypothetical protein